MFGRIEGRRTVSVENRRRPAMIMGTDAYNPRVAEGKAI
jgi:hypothetical protein